MIKEKDGNRRREQERKDELVRESNKSLVEDCQTNTETKNYLSGHSKDMKIKRPRNIKCVTAQYSGLGERETEGNTIKMRSNNGRTNY